MGLVYYDVTKKVLSNKLITTIIVVLIAIVIISIILKKIKNAAIDRRESNARKQKVIKGNLMHEDVFYINFASKLKEAMTGLNAKGRNILFEKLEKFNDDELKFTYNQFGKLITGNNSLLGWIEDEFMPFSSSKDRLVKRMINLNFV